MKIPLVLLMALGLLAAGSGIKKYGWRHPLEAYQLQKQAPTDVCPCLRCKRPWAADGHWESVNGGRLHYVEGWRGVTAHTTLYALGCGVSPLCEECWSELSLQGRLRYYRRLWESWSHRTEEEWDQIRQAVLAGK